jgi:hypothetical protein
MYVPIPSPNPHVHITGTWLTCLEDISREEFPLNSNSAAFFSHVLFMVNQNPVSTTDIRAYVRDVEALDRDIDRRRQYLRAEYRVREANFIRENQARLEEAERELDIESDERQRDLNRRIDSSLHLTQRQEYHVDHRIPRDRMGTTAMDRHSQYLAPNQASADLNQDQSWSRASGHLSGYSSSVQGGFPTLFASESDLRSDQWPVTDRGLDNVFLPVHPPTDDADMNWADTFSEVAARQAMPSTTTRGSHNSFIPADALPTHADETVEVEHAIVMAVDEPRDGSNSSVELSLDSGCGNACVCGRVCPMGRESCDSCASFLDSPPFPEFS